ncbi:MAG: NHL domain-containing protein [Armatimonadota bacterium]
MLVRFGVPVCLVLALASVCTAQPAIIYGDASGDGSVDITDVQIVMRIAVGLTSPQSAQVRASDVYPNPGTFGREVGDGVVNIADAALILRRVFGLVASLGPLHTGLDVSFLYTGPNAEQTGASTEALSSKQLAVLRGRTLKTSGEPLPGVTVSILSHPEFGRVVTHSDGSFDIAVNGGSTLTVEYRLPGYLAAQRKVEVPWRNYAFLPDVVLVPLDRQVTRVELGPSSRLQTARGSVISDADGTRQATLLLPSGASAELVMPDGSSRAVQSLSIRATEFTVGSSGPNAMPAELPPNTAYTYAVEFTADEALSANAASVRFSKPLFMYLENFLDFPAGGVVPTGYYDRAKGQWVPSKNGRIVKVLSMTSGLADLDANGDGTADPPEVLRALEVTDEEREAIARLYKPGQSLWRVPIPHLTPWDCNWPYGPPADAAPPRAEPPQQDTPPEDPCSEAGSVLLPLSQAVVEAVPVAGTPLSLVYRSDRGPGRVSSRSLNIPLAGSDIPASLKRIELEVLVAGQKYTRSFPASAGLSFAFSWDGCDGFGRLIYGSQPATVRIGYVYDAVYLEPDQFEYSFGRFGGARIEGRQTRQEVIIWQAWRGSIGSWDPRTVGVGGWTPHILHSYDVTGGILHLGDGTIRTAQNLGVAVINTVAGRQEIVVPLPTVGPAEAIVLFAPMDVAVASDSSYYIADTAFLYKVGTDGMARSITLPRTQDTAWTAWSISTGPDGLLYIADAAGARVGRIESDGFVTLLAGTGSIGFSGDGGPAVQATLMMPADVAVAVDGSVYIADAGNGRVRRISPDGVITTIAGGGSPSDGIGDGGPAVRARLDFPSSVAVGPDGSVYVSDTGKNRVRRIGLDGIIRTVAGGGKPEDDLGDNGPAVDARLSEPKGIAVGPDGTLFIADTGNHRVRMVDRDGIITTVAGTGSEGYSGDGGPAARAQLGDMGGVCLAPDGSLYIADTGNRRIRRVASGVPGVLAGQITIASVDSSEVFVFDARGKHLRTLDALLGATLYEFTYDANGRFSAVRDGYGNTTTIERDASGSSGVIVGPFGHRTPFALNSDGYLAEIANPAGDTYRFSYTTEGLLTSSTDPNGNTHRYTYDELGRLVRDEGPEGLVKTLSRSPLPNGFSVTITDAYGAAAVHSVQRLAGGSLLFTRSSRCGARSRTLVGPDGSAVAADADGTIVTAAPGPDPRFGLQSPIIAELLVTTPRKLVYRSSQSRRAELSDPVNLFSLKQLADTLTINGRTYSRTYESATRMLRDTTPRGRATTAVLDEMGRPISVEKSSGLLPITISYDARGRIVQEQQGDTSRAYQYDEKGRIASVVLADGSRRSYSYDEADRVTTLTLPSGRTYSFGYEANGNITTITTPAGTTHRLAYNGLDLESAYTSPLGATTSWSYTPDGRLSRIAQPDGTIVEMQYACEGSPMLKTFPEGSVRMEYHPDTGRLTDLRRYDSAGSLVQQASFTYDGGLLLTETWRGAAEASITYSYNADFLPTSLKLESGGETIQVPIGRDADGLAVKYGPFEIKRGGPNGAISSISDGVMTLSCEYDRLGRLSTKTCSVAQQNVYRLQIEYDSLSRISRRVESVVGVTHTYQYSYDADGQLIQVLQDGSPIERYSYDLNGNRTLRQIGSAPEDAAEYDAEDRILKQGGTLFTFDASGRMAKRGEQTFRYSAVDELLQTEVGGKLVNYTYDGYGRCVARTAGGQTQEFIYANQDYLFEITACRYPDGTLDLFFYDDAGRLFAFQRAGRMYYVGVDQVGSPRVVADSAGRAVKILEYTAFGELLSDSNPTFQLPVGFAGGLADPDTGLVLFGWRSYDSIAGRWTSRDPILFEGTDLNLYLYLGNAPLSGRDPSGLQESPYRRPIKPHSEYVKLVKHGTDRAADSVEPLSDKVKNLWRKASDALCGEEEVKEEKPKKPGKRPKELPKFKP